MQHVHGTHVGHGNIARAQHALKQVHAWLHHAYKLAHSSEMRRHQYKLAHAAAQRAVHAFRQHRWNDVVGDAATAIHHAHRATH